MFFFEKEFFVFTPMLGNKSTICYFCFFAFKKMNTVSYNYKKMYSQSNMNK